MNESELLELKRKVDTAKSKVSELKGSEKQLIKELKTNWDCTTVQEAKAISQKKKTEIEQLDQKITEGTEELEEKYNV